MQTEIVLALIPGAISIVLAIWSLITSQYAHSLAVTAEAKARLGEQVRLKGIHATEELLEEIYDLGTILEGLLFALEHQIEVDHDELVAEYLVPMMNHARGIRRQGVVARPYFSSEINDILARFNKLIPMGQDILMDAQNFKDVVEQLTGLTDEVSEHCIKSYMT